MSTSSISTPRILATAIIKKSSISTPRILCTVVPSTDTNYYFDTDVKTKAYEEKYFDTQGSIKSESIKHYDAKIDYSQAVANRFDTSSIVTKELISCFDTSVSIESKDIKSIYFDTAVSLKADVIANYDTSVNKQGVEKYYFDTASRIIPGDVTAYFDTSIRKTSVGSVTAYFDTVSKLLIACTKHFDTSVAIPHDTSFIPFDDDSDPFKPVHQKPKHGMVSMNINLQELSLSDSFDMDTTMELNILDIIQGKILDFDYRYMVSETEQQDTVLTAKGMYDIDELLYRPINYSMGKMKHKLSEHMEAIASALGKKLNFRARDFTHTGTWVGDGQTYESIISTLFGWSSSIPNQQINVFMRAGDNSINVIQRGYEVRVIDITDTNHTRATYNRSLERTMWTSGNSSSGGNNDGHSLYVEPLPFWGTLTFGDAVCSYESGYLTSEENGGSISNYTYIGDGFGENKYLSQKVITHPDGSITDIRYDYNKGKGGVLILGTETEITTDSKGNSSIRKTTHAPLGNGFYGTSVYVDGEFQGSSIGTGSPAATASRFLKNQESITFGGPQYDSSGLGYGQSLLKETNFPIADEDIVRDYVNNIKWLNRRIKETVTMDIYQYDHVIDFTERIRFKGHEYFLVSNAVTQTTTEVKQSVQLVRWY